MIQKHVTDLGAAAYLMMHKFKVIGRRGKSIYFEVDTEEDSDLFDEKIREYLSSEFHRFDACIMSLKKMVEYMPEQG